MSAFHDIAEAFRAYPDIKAVQHHLPDEWVPHERWTVTLRDGWLAQHTGLGGTIVEAYADARAKLADIRRAA